MIKNYVTYEEFGAVGDGVADDFLPIYKAHEYANVHGIPVKTHETKTYRIHHTLIGEGEDIHPETIKIKTDVNWGKTHFIIDDSDINPFESLAIRDMSVRHVFEVASDHEFSMITDRKVLDRLEKECIGPGTTKIDLGFEREYPVMIIPTNDRHKVYRRVGPYTPDIDKSRSELIVLDKDGNVSEETPLMFDYKSISYISVYRIDDTPVTVRGGIFTTRACELNVRPDVFPDGTPNTSGRYFSYFYRGLYITRSNTLIEGVEHYVTGEIDLVRQSNGEMGVAYNGFFSAAYANHVKFKDCILTGRRKYLDGTYELAGLYVNKIVFEGCKQSNFWITIDDNTYEIKPSFEGAPGARTSMTIDYHVNGVNIPYVHWGLGGTNFCKNMEYIDSRLSRFDAHEGLYNGRIKNSELNAIYVTGAGKLELDGVRFFANFNREHHQELFNSIHNTIVFTRGDYGCIWDGEIIIKNLDAYMYTGDSAAILLCGWTNWYFGYETFFPSMTIENLNIFDAETFEPLDNNYALILCRSDPYISEHLDKCQEHPRYQVVDRNGDGFVDDPLDCEMPLIFEGKPITMDEAMKRVDQNYPYRYALCDTTSWRNINKKRPPKFIKIINSNVTVSVEKTAGKGIPNGAYYGVREDGDGGFLGCTKFYYEKDKFLQGTGEDTSKIENCPFVFE